MKHAKLFEEKLSSDPLTECTIDERRINHHTPHFSKYEVLLFPHLLEFFRERTNE